MSFIDHVDANMRSREDQAAIYHDGQTITYGELNKKAKQFANVLEEQGVEVGDKVSLYSGNQPRFVIAWLGAMKRGAVPFAINTRFAGEEVKAVIEDGDAVVHVHTTLNRDLLEYVREVDDLETIYAAGGDTPEGTVDLDESIAAADSEYETVSQALDDAAELMFTSGTTGRPKPAIHTHRNLISAAMGTVSRYNLSSDDTGILATPIFHIAGGMILTASLLVGSPFILIDGWDPEKYLEQVEKHRGSFAHLVTTMVIDLVNLDEETLESYDTESFRVTYSGGGVTTDETIETYQEHISDWLAEGYGMTESCGGPGTQPFTERRTSKVSEFKRGIKIDPRQWEVRIVDPETREELPPGEEGEILIKGDAVSPGYYNQPEKTEAAFKDGWLSTDDSGYVDEDGYIYYLGRVNDMIKSGGENIFPAEVESTLSNWERVSDAVVFGVPDERWGEKVATVIEPADESLTEDDVVEYFKSTDEIADYKRPRAIALVDDVPKLESQKHDVQAARDIVLEME